MKLLLKIRYDGSAYSGFQCQPNAPTVQSVLTERFSQAFGFPCTVTGCSRTDAGVHALGYIAAVEPAENDKRGDEWCNIPVGKIHRVLNMNLPSDISVMGAAFVPDTFHPRYDTVSKEYLYLIDDSVYPDPFFRDRVWHLKRKVSDRGIELMNEGAKLLMGKHDFSSFMASGSSVTDTVRTLFELKAERDADGKIRITARGDGFLYNMVRILTGTLLDVAFEKIKVSQIKEILERCDRRLAGPTAPPCGLYLKEVTYSEVIDFSAE